MDTLTETAFIDEIAETFALESSEVVLDATLVDDLEMDSLARLELLLVIEQLTGSTLPDDATATLLTVGDAYDLYRSHMAPTAEAA